MFAAALRGFTGFGFALAAVPLASLVLPPQTAVVTTLLLQAAIGLRDCVAERYRCDWRAVMRLTLGSIGGTPLGVLALTVLPLPMVRLALGALVAVAVAVSWRPPRQQGRPAGRWALLAGFGSGVCNGLAAMSGPPAIVYFLIFEPSRAVMRSTLMAYFPLAALFAIPPVAVAGLLNWQVVMLAAMGLPLMLAGGWAGAWMFHRAGHRSYRAAATAALLFTALASIGKGLAGL
ncbi:sulfite exporter TauE/SafE family protein [Limobrevibacterium gyesilva]|uniref:Probable membrane transporter protein n=1 Tax=Limobrevibacterium gyesilva TaxID=2991712 RepID=A0AA41YTT6_9PROT|nr:sulfite exporter TauE/SafE family protein [Limobrevibacterium gyesilva]MCW3476438.1 sulfite exporter TauE/SafE family protein [Limobrevibacterium gyesilva]